MVDTAGTAEVRHGETGELLRRARAGDRSAIDRLVTDLTPLLWNIARARGLGREAAADVVQATWISFLENLNEIRSPDAVAGWLVTVARRHAQKARARQRRIELVEPNDLTGQPDPDTAVDAALADREQYQCLWDNLRKLPPTCQEMLRILAATGRTARRDVLEVLDMPPGSIGPTRIRCLHKLRALLQADPRWNPK